MRLLLMFDMPTKTPGDKREYRRFRKFLLSEGFVMHQFSVYTKLVLNDTATESMMKRLNKNKPKDGIVSVLKVTEKQYARIVYITGNANKSVQNSDARVIYLGVEPDELES
jgi:CRISPR-associated protein Cas2